jgi:hypothetical protein
MSRNSCTHLKQVNLDAEAKTKWDLIGYIYGFVYHVVMLYAVILQKINMALNTSKQQLILSSSFEPGENWKWCYVDEIFMK